MERQEATIAVMTREKREIGRTTSMVIKNEKSLYSFFWMSFVLHDHLESMLKENVKEVKE